MKAIQTRYHAPTNVRGARISAFDSDKNRVSLPYPYEDRSSLAHAAAAIALCKKMRWTGTLQGGYLPKGDMVWVFLDPYLQVATEPLEKESP